jgi:hypothetical protein
VRGSFGVALAALATLTALPARAETAAPPAQTETATPTHLGETGYLDVPVAESQGRGGAAFSLDLRYSQASDVSRTVMPSPLVMSFGLGRGEVGFSLRQGGLPGDSRPYATVPAGVGKFSVLEAKGKRPALAADLVLDHINRNPAIHLRAIATTLRAWRVRATAFAGGVIGIDRPSGFTAGAALSVAGPRQTEFVVEGLRQPSGLVAGAAIRWLVRPQFLVGLGASYLPDDARTLVAGLTVAFLNPAPVKPSRATEAEQAQEETKQKKGKRAFTSERPRFALELRERPLPGAEGGPAPHYPGSAPAAETAPQETAAAAEPAPSPKVTEAAVEVVKGEKAKVEEPTGPTTLPMMRGDRIVQRKVIDSEIITLRSARATPNARERDAIKKLALRATAGEGDLVIWAATVGSDSNRLLSAVGRATAVTRLAVKLAKLRKNNFGIQIGQGEPASKDRILIALLAPEPGATPATSRPKRTEAATQAGTAIAATAVPVVPVEPPPIASPAVESPQTPVRSDAGDAGAVAPDAKPAQVEPPATLTKVPDENRDAGATAPDALPDARPERVERQVPLPPTLKEGTSAKDQVGKAIASFQPALKECANRALKRDLGLRGEARIDLDILPNGRVKLEAIHSKTLAGGWFEDCVRQAAAAWRMPRTQQGYQVEIPLKLHIANGGSP